MNKKTFFHPVSTFSTTGKTAKGRALQEMAMKFDRMLIEGENPVYDLILLLREIAASLDAQYPRTRPTFVEWTLDNEGNGMITAAPVADNGAPIDKDYFRITFNTVAAEGTIKEIFTKLTSLSSQKGGDR